MVFLSLFDEKQVLEYLEKRFPKTESTENSDKQSKSLSILKKAKSLSFRPFLLSHIEDLLDSEDREWTELSVYDELVSVWLRREVRKKSSIKLSERDLWLASIAISAKMQESGKRHLTNIELNRIIKSIPEVGYINFIEYGSKSLLNRNSTGNYRFSHFSVQEYFLCKYVIALADKRQSADQIKRIPVNRSSIRLTRKSLEFISFHVNNDWSYNNGFLLENLNLDGFNFSEGNYSGCSFANSLLRNSNFKSASLLNANFTGSVLTGSVFDESNCSDASFVSADLSNTSFVDVSSSKAKFADAVFKNTNLKGLSDLGKLSKNTEFIETIMPDGKRWDKKS